MIRIRSVVVFILVTEHLIIFFGSVVSYNMFQKRKVSFVLFVYLDFCFGYIFGFSERINQNRPVIYCPQSVNKVIVFANVAHYFAEFFIIHSQSNRAEFVIILVIK